MTKEKRQQKKLLKKPWTHKRNKTDDVRDAKPFYDIAAGPRFGKLQLTNIQGFEQTGFKAEKKARINALKNDIKIRKFYQLGHNQLFSDPYVGTISYRQADLVGLKRDRYAEKFAVLNTVADLHNKVGVTYTWFEGAFPGNLFKPRKIYSENFEVTHSSWSGTTTLKLKDWRRKTPWFIYSMYTIAGLMVIIFPSTLVPLLTG